MAGREENRLPHSKALKQMQPGQVATTFSKEEPVMAVEMNRQDLLELYQLVVMYNRCYGLELKELLEGISEKYRKNTGGEDIRSSRNPRCAGRKKIYAEDTDRTILELRNGGMTLREIAGTLQCSIGHVQDVLKRWGNSV